MTELSDLKINYLPAPTGVTGDIELSWELCADRRDVVQQSYQVQLLLGGKTVYDSGVVRSSRSVQVRVGLDWQSIARYTVRVRCTAAGETTDWLQGRFVTGFQQPQEWRGRFISAEPESDRGKSYGTLLRKEFEVKKPLAEAWLVASAHGLYHCFLNGARVSDSEMAPGWTSYHKRLLYQTCEVSGLLQPGRNAWGVMLGAGWYKGMMGHKHTRNNYGVRTAFGGQLLLRYADGSEEWVLTDESWQGSRGPVLFSEIYGGETYDARAEQPGWHLPGFDSRHWQGVERVARDKRTLFPQQGCPVRVQQWLEPVALLTTPAGDTVLDFGQNMTGWCELTLEAPPAGAVVELEFFEVLDADGNVYTENLRGIHQIVRYICRGLPREVYRPWFTFQGFQYARVVSFPGPVRPQQIRAAVLHSDMQRTGHFRCSSALVNQLHHNILWGMKDNFLDIPTDCPQRDERLGWTGDVQVFARTSALLMNTDAFYRKWLADVAADQDPGGAVSYVVPDILTGHMEGDWLLDQQLQGGASGWGDVIVVVPWTLYQLYGDTEVLRLFMPAMLEWIRFMREHSEGCLFRFGAQFGDWLALDAAPGSYKGATPDEYVCAAYYCCSTALVGKMLHCLGREAEARQLRAQAEALCADFRRRFFMADGSLKIQTQTAHVLALAFRLAEDAQRPALADRLCQLLRESGGHLTTGFLGTPYLLSALSQNGKLAEAYALLLREDFPGWLYQVKSGATTVWEHWDGRRPDGSMWSPDMNSFNHYAYGAVGEWLYRAVAGLEVDEEAPGFAHFFISPQIGGGLTCAETLYHSVRGRIYVGWQRRGDEVTLTAEIPANTRATFRLPQARQLVDGDGLCFVGAPLQAQAGSGRYVVKYLL